ncbi:MAG: ribosomal protein methyltransferase, partial [Chloroflexi bacterium]|nr:ribosomal protein methyltransferase [Chloroflexota bacterium]
PVAVSAARSNVRRNRLARVISIYEGSIDSSLSERQTPFDLVLANVTARVNTELARPMSNLLRPGGLLVASGILADSASSVRDAFAAVGLEVFEERPDGDWVALIARRGP